MTERTAPLKFVVESFSLYVREQRGGKVEPVWAAEIRWDDDDGCFVLESGVVGNYDFAPCDLDELARILRGVKREP